MIGDQVIGTSQGGVSITYNRESAVYGSKESAKFGLVWPVIPPKFTITCNFDTVIFFTDRLPAKYYDALILDWDIMVFDMVITVSSSSVPRQSKTTKIENLVLQFPRNSMYISKSLIYIQPAVAIFEKHFPFNW